LTEVTNGLYISAKDKRLALFIRVDGKDFLYLRTPSGFLMMNPTVFSLKTKFEKGLLESDILKNGGTMVNWAKEIPVTLHIDGACYTGLVCKYPAGRAKSFHFKNWELELSDPTTPPTEALPVSIDYIKAFTSTDVRIDFSEEVKAADATFLVKQTGEKLKCNTKGTEPYVELEAKNKFDPALKYDMTITGLKNADNQNVAEIKTNFFYEISEDIQRQDVVISEIMANPKGAAGLPEVEYVELFNNEDKSVSLQNWTFYYGEKMLKIPAFIMPEKTSLIIGKKSAIDQLDCDYKLAIPNFPILANIGNIMHLEDDRSRLVSWVDYSIDWHDSNKKQGGYSLEIVDASNKSGEASNWKSSKAAAGGTPGKENSVRVHNPDTVLPEVLAVDLLDDKTLKVTFAKTMDYQSIADIDKYVIKAEFDLIVLALQIPYPKSDHLLLPLSKSVMPGDSLKLEIDEMKCTAGFTQRAYKGNEAWKIIRAKEPEEGDILISELLYYPYTNEAEFIELYNNSSYPIRISDLVLATVKSDGTYQYLSPLEKGGILAPQKYLLITKDFESIKKKYDITDLQFLSLQSKMPAYANTGGIALVLNKEQKEIDRFAFSPKLHTVAAKDQQGVSLERISFLKDTNEASNWQSSPGKVKYATPGYENSQNVSEEGESADLFSIDTKTKVFRPLRANEEESNWILEYNIPEKPIKLSLSAFDSNGILVKEIVRNKECKGFDRLLWDGTNSKGKIMPIGVYILLLEYIDQKGNLARKKWVTTLTN
ncbi:MAG: lamin tail domain-containing protein, partial [Bacteroidales bacterium]